MLQHLLSLLQHPETMFQRQGLMLLEGLEDEDIWTHLMRGVQFSAKIEHSKYQLTSGLVTAVLKSPFYDYSQITELYLTGQLPFDLDDIQLKNLTRLRVQIADFYRYQAYSQGETEEELFFFQGLRQLQTVTALEIEFQKVKDVCFPSEIVDNLQNITTLDVVSLRKNINIDIDFLHRLPYVTELNLQNMLPTSSISIDHPAKINMRFAVKHWPLGSGTGQKQFGFEVEKLTLYTEKEAYRSNNKTEVVHLRMLAGLKIREIRLAFNRPIYFAEVFALLDSKIVPIFRNIENCSWGFEEQLPLNELLQDPQQIPEKLSEIKQKIEKRGFCKVRINTSLNYWNRVGRDPILKELAYLKIDEVHLYFRDPKIISLEKYDVDGIPLTIKKIVVVSGKWSEEKQQWFYAGCEAAMITDFSGLKVFSDLEEIELHNFHRIKHKNFKKCFSGFPKLRKIKLVKCKVSGEAFAQMLSSFLPNVELVVQNNI